MKAYLGIDLGTSAVKVLLLGEDGRTLCKTSRTYELILPGVGEVEQDPLEWWQAVSGATLEALNRVPDAQVKAVGVSGQLNGLVLLGPDAAPLGNAVIWLDSRAVREAHDLNEHHGELLIQQALTQAQPINVVSKLLWFKRHRRGHLLQATRVLLAKDFINYRLTGAVATEATDASCTAMFSLQSRDWMWTLLRDYDLPGDLLPRAHNSADVVGQVTRQAARETGIPEGTPVVAGLGDVAALTLGSGVTDLNRCGISLGTAGHVVTVNPDLYLGPARPIWQMSNIAPGSYINLGLVMTAGHSLKWASRALTPASDASDAQRQYEAFTHLAAQAPPGSSALTFLPFLEGASTPYLAPELSAAFIGLRTAHTPAHLARAVLEGVAYNVRDCLEQFQAMGARSQELRISEGGSRSRLWCQIISDVIGLPLVTLAEEDASALGAAMIGVLGCGDCSPDELVERFVRWNPADLIEPDDRNTAVYEDAYRRYQQFALRLQ